MEQNNNKVEKIINETPRFFPHHPNYSKAGTQFVAETKHPVYITKMKSIKLSTLSERASVGCKNKISCNKSNGDSKIHQDDDAKPKKHCQTISARSNPQDVLEDEEFSTLLAQLKKQLDYSPPISDLSSDSS